MGERISYVSDQSVRKDLWFVICEIEANKKCKVSLVVKYAYMSLLFTGYSKIHFLINYKIVYTIDP